MAQGGPGGRGEILGLLAVLADYEEFITYDLLTIGHEIAGIGHTISWPQLEIFLRHHPGAYAREYRRRAAEAAKPEEERVVGGDKADAMTIPETIAWLGWTEPALEGGE